MTTAHTATPWQMLPAEQSKNYLRIRGTQLGCKYKICNVDVPDYEGVNQHEIDEAHANAEFIVRACNRDHAFDDLVKALESMVDFYGKRGGQNDELLPDSLQYPEVVNARAVLAKAGV